MIRNVLETLFLWSECREPAPHEKPITNFKKKTNYFSSLQDHLLQVTESKRFMCFAFKNTVDMGYVKANFFGFVLK